MMNRRTPVHEAVKALKRAGYLKLREDWSSTKEITLVYRRRYWDKGVEFHLLAYVRRPDGDTRYEGPLVHPVAK